MAADAAGPEAACASLRAALASDDAEPSAADLLGLRNAFASPAGARRLGALGALRVLAGVLERFADRGADDQADRFAAQALANAAVSGASVWTEVSPATLARFAERFPERQVLSPLAYCVFVACRADDAAARSLHETEAGRDLLRSLLWDNGDSVDEVETETCGLLMSDVCLTRDGLAGLLGDADCGDRAELDLWVVRLFAHLLADVSTSMEGGTVPSSGLSAARTLLRWAEKLAGSGAPLDDRRTFALKLLLRLLRTVFGRDESVDASASSLPARLVEADVATVAVELLRLAPVPRPDAVAPGSTEAVRVRIPESNGPYRGYKTDVVAVLANVAFGRPAVKRAILDAGGLDLILCHTRSDKDAPLTREWALFAVRNMCESFVEAQDAIRELQVQQVVDDQVLQQAGISVKVEQETGKLSAMRDDRTGEL